jgi:gliding motility-associated-like protein
MLTFFLGPCSGYQVSDSTYIAGSSLTPEVALLPEVPQPVPDGQGVIAVSDYGFVPGGVYVNPDYKSFASTCLTRPLRKDSLYRFDFYAGFGKAGSGFLEFSNQILGPEFSTSPETFGLFGMTDCSAVGNPIPLYSCIDRAGWIPLGEVKISGGPGEWTKASILFTPPVDITAIAVGPSCDTNFSDLPFTGTHDGKAYNTNRYAFFLDSLQFYGADAPPPMVSLVSGDSCSAEVVLEAEPAAYYAGSSLQWFRNDSLLSGQQDTLITIPRKFSGADIYRCRVSNDTLCLVSNAYPVNWTPIPTPASLGAPDTSVCQSDTLLLRDDADPGADFNYRWGDGSTRPYFAVTRDGTYSVTISDGCGTVQAQKTVHFVKCDYDVYVPNAFTPNADGRNDLFRAHFFTPPASFLMQVFSRDGLEVFSTMNSAHGWDGDFDNVRQPTGTYIWAIQYRDAKGKSRSVTGTVILIR